MFLKINFLIVGYLRTCSVPLKCTLDIPLVISMDDILQAFTSPQSIAVCYFGNKAF